MEHIVRLQLKVKDSIHRQLKKHAIDARQTMSELAEELIEEGLKKREPGQEPLHPGSTPSINDPGKNPTT